MAEPNQLLDSLRANYFLNPYAIGHWLISHLVLFLGIFVFLQNKKSIINIAYLLISISAYLWLLVDAMLMSCTNERIALQLAKVVYIGISLIPPSMYFFSASWLSLLGKMKKWVMFNYFLALFFIALILLTDKFVTGVYHHFFGFFSKSGEFLFVYLIFFFGVSGLFFWNLIQGYSKETMSIKKIQIRQVLIAFILCFILGVTEYLPTFGIEFYPIGFVAVFILISVIAHAIIRYKLWEIETAIHKTLAWFLTSLVLIAPLVVLLYLTRDWYSKWNSVGMMSFLGGVLLSFLFFVKTAQPRIDQFFQRGQFDLESILNQFQDDLVHLRGLEELVNKITDTLVDTFYPSRVVILVYNDRIKKMTNVGGTGDRQWQLDPEEPFFKWLAKNNRILNQELIEIDPRCEPIRSQAKAHFRELEVSLCIPLALNEKLLGLIHLGRKGNLKPYTARDFGFLSRFKNQVSVALSNSLVFGRVEEMVKTRTDELMQAQQQLIQAEKLATLGTLAGGVANEINHPLGTILMNAKMLLNTVDNGEEKEPLQLIQSATQRCGDIIEKLMIYSRRPLAAREVANVDLEKVVKDVLSFLAHQLSLDNISVKIKFERPPFIIRGCQDELEQVMTNLVLNSRDAIKSFKKEGEILIFISNMPEKILLEVKDDGIGIPPEKISRIFDPFFTTKDVGKGTGLGLSICQSIVEQHGGTIQVKSQPGEGATFTITIPKSFNPDMNKGTRVSSSIR